jgi:HSP20 family protein
MSTTVEPAPGWLRNFDRYFAGPEARIPQFVPPADVLVRDEGVTVYLDVPGLRSEDLEIELENDALTIRGERPYPYGEEDGGRVVRRVERGFGRFERSLRVPPGLNPDAVEATVALGVLTLKVPRPEAPKPHRIQIRTGEGSEPGTIEGTAH